MPIYVTKFHNSLIWVCTLTCMTFCVIPPYTLIWAGMLINVHTLQDMMASDKNYLKYILPSKCIDHFVFTPVSAAVPTRQHMHAKDILVYEHGGGE